VAKQPITFWHEWDVFQSWTDVFWMNLTNNFLNFFCAIIQIFLAVYIRKYHWGQHGCRALLVFVTAITLVIANIAQICLTDYYPSRGALTLIECVCFVLTMAVELPTLHMLVLNAWIPGQE